MRALPSRAWHRALETALGRAGLPLVKINPLQARRFAQACGTRVKTDPVDAEMLRNPDRFCALVFDGREGLGGLFTTMAQQVAQMTADQAGAVLGRHLIELLALSLGQNSNGTAGSAVRAAHLRRAQQIVLRNLANPDLAPGLVADACKISKRYLHEVFADQNCTVAQFIREQRLIAARALLQMPNPGPMSDVAYRFGFSDQAQFSRLFKAMFGQTPSGYRAMPRPARPEI